MSTSPHADRVRTVAELYRLFAEGRLEETFALMHREVALLEPGDPRLLPWAGEFRGHEGLRRFYDGLAGALADLEIDAAGLSLERLDSGRVLATGTERGTAARTGRSYESQSAWIWTVESGLIRGLTAYHDTAAMAEALRP